MRDNNEEQHEHRDNEVLADTSRVETYSDAIIAIIMTLLIFDLKIPHVDNPSTAVLMDELRKVLPNFLTFVLSFATLAVVWINHHHFFHPILGTNRALLWINNGLLFGVCVIPFAAGLLGNYPSSPLAVGLYGLVMLFVTTLFAILVRYVFFSSDLVNKKVPLARRRREFRRACLGPAAYIIGAAFSFWLPWVSLVVYVLVPVYYLVPNSLE